MNGWLKRKRLEKCMSLEAVASKCGITRQALWLIESKERTPSVETAKRIANVLEFNWTRFYEEDDYGAGEDHQA